MKSYYYSGGVELKKRHTKKLYYLLLFLFISSITIWFFSYIDNRFLPVLKELSHIHCKAYTNKIINSALDEILSENEQNLSDFVFYDIYEERYIANTLLLNQFCTTLNENIAADLSKFPSEKIIIPFGAVFDASLLADKGPDISFTIYPAGNVATNYESEFISAGINQTNYKIWLNISIELQIVNPFYKEGLKLHRKILLADIIFNGKVPEHYFQMASTDEYLLTE